MLKLDNNLLEELGLGGLPEDQKRSMLQHIYETLELRVGTNLANQMTDQQLEEFEKFIDEGGDANQAQALQWLETNLPNYKQVVNDVFEALKVEIKQMAPQIVASSAQQPAVPPAGPSAPAADPYAAPAAPASAYQQPAAAPAPQYAQPQPPAYPGSAAVPPQPPAPAPDPFVAPQSAPQQAVPPLPPSQPAPGSAAPPAGLGGYQPVPQGFQPPQPPSQQPPAGPPPQYPPQQAA